MIIYKKSKLFFVNFEYLENIKKQKKKIYILERFKIIHMRIRETFIMFKFFK